MISRGFISEFYLRRWWWVRCSVMLKVMMVVISKVMIWIRVLVGIFLVSSG